MVILKGDLNVIIQMLMQKIQPVRRLNFTKAENINIEEMALSYLYLCIIILFEYDNSSHRTLRDAETDMESVFKFEEWIKEMQNILASAERRLVGW